MYRPLSLLLFSALLSGCASSAATPAPTPSPPVTTGTAEVKVFALSDFHGWLLPRQTRSNPRFYGGIAHVAGWLKHREKANPEEVLILDNGDMWTGPTESTFLKGAPVVEAYNLIGVTAANIANHEFDFGREVLEKRAEQAQFPFLGANIVEHASGRPPVFVKPWVVVERQGIKVGILGLSFIDTPSTTLAKNVEGLQFLGYAETLRAQVPKLRAAGAEILCVLLHDVPTVGVELMNELGPELGVDLVVAGQDHRKATLSGGGIPVVNPGPFGASYAKFMVSFDRTERRVLEVKAELVDVTGPVGNSPYPPVPELVAVADRAHARVRALSENVLGRLAKPLPVGDFEQSPMGQFIVDTWLVALAEEVDFAMMNHGAVRQPLPAGTVTLADVTSVMPFENNIYIVELTGAQIASQLAIDHPVVGGLTWTYRPTAEGRQVVRMLDPSGRPLGLEQVYSVAILDFMYTGGDGFEFAQLDETPTDTGLSWRDPVVRAFRTAEAASRPLSPQGRRRASIDPSAQ